MAISVPIQIVAAELAVPPQVQTAESLAPLLGCDAQWIHEHTGVAERRVADPTVMPEQLAAEAARPLLATHGAPDLLVYAGAIPRQLIPDNAVFVARELGLEGIPAFTINSTCLSSLVAMQTAAAWIQQGAAKRALICSSELATRGRNLRERESAALMGDGAAAMLLEGSIGANMWRHFAMETWPKGAELTEVRAGGVGRLPGTDMSAPEDAYFRMDGEALLRRTIPRLKKFLGSFLREADIKAEQIDLLIPHQPSGPALRLLPKLGFAPERIVNILPRYGNCVAASLPMALAAAIRDKRIQRGNQVLFLGTAAGISIGAGLLEW